MEGRKARRIESPGRIEERKACSSLFELSDTICAEYRPFPPLPTHYGSSPWHDTPCLHLRRPTLLELGPRARSKHLVRVERSRRRHRSSIKEGSIPKLLKTELLTSISIQENSQNEAEELTYASQQVLHITRTLKEDSQHLLDFKKQALVPRCARLDPLTRKDKENRGPHNPKQELSWQLRTRTLKAAKRKRLRQLANGVPGVTGNAGSPLSRLLLQKYLVLL